MNQFTFLPYQIAEMAMSIEEEGAKFYIALSNLTKSQKLKEIFASLSKAEMNHKKKFLEIANANHKEPSAEYSINLHMVMKSHTDKIAETSFDLESKPDIPQTILEALDMAIDIEKTSIEIFMQMKEASVHTFAKILTAIITEEEAHLEVLENIKGGIK